jgi:hypothetical protein
VKPAKSLHSSFLLCAVLSSSLTLGCASAPVQTDKEVVLQDPFPGRAMVYLIRAPHDSEPIEVRVGELPAITLPSGTYTLLSIAPGTHSFRTVTERGAERRIEIAFHVGERRFFYLSGENASSIGDPAIVAVVGGPLLAALNRTDTVEGSRTWKECTELDARGLISISKLVSSN